MRSLRVLAALGLLASWVLVAPAPAQGTDPESSAYTLVSPPSRFEWGCFGPCACPILVRSPLSGTFVLHLLHTDPLYTTYEVRDVHWSYPESAQPGSITGSGTYRRGGEVAQEEQLTLDLSFNGGPTQHFDSGLVAPGATFPAIATRISLHGEYCHDSVLTVSAKPVNTAGTKDGVGRRLSLTVSPNPFTASVGVEFGLPVGGPVRLSVYDVAGRRACALVQDEWLPRGAFTRSWDGRLESGAPAPAGCYVVQLDAETGTLRRALTKLR